MTNIADYKYLKRFKLNDVYKILKWAFNKTKRPGFMQIKSAEKPFSVNFVFIEDFKQNEFVLPSNCKLKLNEKLNFSDLPFFLTREVKICNITPDLSVLTKENLNLVSFIEIEQLYDSEIFVENNPSLKCPDKNNLFINDTPHFLIALDIEMVTTEIGKEVGRISLVDHTGNVLYDKFVKPVNCVQNYETKWSGLTKTILDSGIDNSVMKNEICKIIGKNTVLLGHSLENDFSALGMYHNKIIDTSYLFLDVRSRRIALKELSRFYLNTIIQDGSHCSITNAITCLKLLSIKIQEMLAVHNKSSPDIKINQKILYHKGFKEFVENQEIGLNICVTKSNEVKSNINRLNKTKNLTFYWYEEDNKIKFEF
ncbi:hypothetical protein NCER_100757 [Vairimorpha ceranae BRL01]|uniref:Exonuclease domain-containing protein n=1 Tax=Vairimorpha ceranae (strain BRL01) TaxID=578460 RepID=C4V8E3_VAIC1|nr:hypothetical protein NCER_100757 [Vairimorpha ceranae BRL01]